MRRSVGAWVSAAAIAVALATGAAPARADPVRLMLDYAFQGQQAPFLLAQENGYFSRAGVEVQVDRGYGSADAITKVATGTYDMGFADIGAMLQFDGSQGGDKVVSVFQVYEVAPMVMLSLKASGIHVPADLAGKKIASPPAASSRVMFPLLAAANHLDADSVTWLNVTPQLRETMLARHQADATTALITDLAGLGQLGISESDVAVMRYGDFGVRLYGHCILTTPQFAAAHPDAVRAVVKGFAAALKDAIANPDLAIAAEKKRDPLIEPAVERRRLQLVIENAILSDHVRQAGLSAIEPERLQQTIEMVAQVFKVPAPKAEAIYRPEFLPPRAELMLH